MFTLLDTLGLALRTRRRLAGMTLAEVAEATGLSASFLSDVENGKSDPSLATLRKLARCYHTNIEILIGGKSE